MTETITIHVTDARYLNEWAFDPLSLEPLYNPDGTRMRQRIRISDYDDPTNATYYEVMGIDREAKTIDVQEVNDGR